MIDYNKSEVKNKLTLENIYSLLDDWGGMPEYTDSGIIASTICHNQHGGSRKLYYYENSKLFHCYSGCEEPSFDIFQLLIQVKKLQEHKEIDLNTAVRQVAQRFGIAGVRKDDEEEDDLLEDWKILENYDRIQEISIQPNITILKEYDKTILSRFNYNVKIEPWLKEGISEYAMKMGFIGYYPGGDQITIPHFDRDNRFIGLRGRTLSQEEGELYGKYRPLKISGVLYNHPLGMNLYGLNWAKDTIQTFKKAVIYESEKSVLQHISHFPESNIAVACCGSNLTAHQVQLLLDLEVNEIIIAFDRDFQRIGDEEHKRLKNNLTKIHNKFKNYVNVSFIFDRNMITSYKASPIDEGPEKFLKLFNKRIML